MTERLIPISQTNPELHLPSQHRNEQRPIPFPENVYGESNMHYKWKTLETFDEEFNKLPEVIKNILQFSHSNRQQKEHTSTLQSPRQNNIESLTNLVLEKGKTEACAYLSELIAKYCNEYLFLPRMWTEQITLGKKTPQDISKEVSTLMTEMFNTGKAPYLSASTCTQLLSEFDQHRATIKEAFNEKISTLKEIEKKRDAATQKHLKEKLSDEYDQYRNRLNSSHIAKEYREHVGTYILGHVQPNYRKEDDRKKLVSTLTHAQLIESLLSGLKKGNEPLTNTEFAQIWFDVPRYLAPRTINEKAPDKTSIDAFSTIQQKILETSIEWDSSQLQKKSHPSDEIKRLDQKLETLFQKFSETYSFIHETEHQQEYNIQHAQLLLNIVLQNINKRNVLEKQPIEN